MSYIGNTRKDCNGNPNGYIYALVRVHKKDNSVDMISYSEDKEYYLNNSKHIFDYFEDKKDINKGNTKTKQLNAFFNIDKSISSNPIKKTTGLLRSISFFNCKL